MKLTRDKLKQIIKEELEEMMGPMSAETERSYSSTEQQPERKSKVNKFHLIDSLLQKQQIELLMKFKDLPSGDSEFVKLPDGSGRIGNVQVSPQEVQVLNSVGVL